MEILATELPGLQVIRPRIFEDARGSFVKTFHVGWFHEQGIDFAPQEEFFSTSAKDVVRGMHFQSPPAAHAKVVYCLRGRVLDVVLDLRKNSPTFGRCQARELNSTNREILFIPIGFAHGFLALEQDTTMIYQTSTVHSPACDAGIVWNSFGFDWPVKNPIVSERDKKISDAARISVAFLTLMKILFTGASSFTGFWFVKMLAAAGHEIVCPITGEINRYTGVGQLRVEKLKSLCRLVPSALFGSDNFLKLTRAEHFDQFCHHAADVTNYKSADFDTQAAVRNNTHNLAAVLTSLRERGLKSVVLTGTYFEAGEGAGSEPLRTFSPYSLSKTLTFEAFQLHCRAAGLPLGKFVIPNPFGPLEEPRFTSFLMNNWKAGKPVEVKTPDYIRDNIHVDLLAAVYAKFSAQVAVAKELSLKINPSGYAEKQGAFAERVAREVQTRTGWTCELRLATQEDFSEPLHRTNIEPAAKLVPEWNEAKAWDGFVFHN